MSKRCHGRLWAVWKAAAVALLLTVLRPPRAFSGVGSRKPPSARCPRLAVKAEELSVAVDGIQEESPIPLRDAAAQSKVDSQFLERLNASATPAELLELLATHRNNLRLAESTRVVQKLLELTSAEELKKLTQEAILVELLRFQVDALKTLQLPPALIVSLASLGQQLESLHEGVLLTTALQALKPKNMRVSELRAVLASPLAGIKELRREILEAMTDTVHRMSPEVMVVVLNTLAEYQEQPEELLDEVIARVEEKSFRMTPNEGLGVLYALARLEKFNLALLKYFGNQAAVDISPFSLQELSHWAEVLRRLNFRNQKLVDILVKATTWRGESMSDEQLNAMLLCFKHFEVSKESILPIEEIAGRRGPHGGEEKSIDA